MSLGRGVGYRAMNYLRPNQSDYHIMPGGMLPIHDKESSRSCRAYRPTSHVAPHLPTELLVQGPDTEAMISLVDAPMPSSIILG